MKKIISFLLTAAIILNFGIITASAEEASLSVRELSAAAPTDAYKGYRITQLYEDCKVKKSALNVADNEILIVHSGATLRLYQGARIDGSVYIENGAKLYVLGGTLTVSRGGAVFSDGVLYAGEKGAVNIKNRGELFIGKRGRMKITSQESLTIGALADVVCLGKNNSDNSAVGTKVIAAYVTKNGNTASADSKTAVFPESADYCNDFTFEISRRLSAVTFVFDSGACFRVLNDNGKLAFIGNSCTAIFGSYTEGSSTYCRVYEINGKDYVYDVKTGISIASLDKSGKLVNSDGSKPDGVWGEFDKDNCEYLGNIRKFVCGDKSNIPSAGAYLLQNGCVLVMDKLNDSLDNNGNQLYDVYILALAE